MATRIGVLGVVVACGLAAAAAAAVPAPAPDKNIPLPAKPGAAQREEPALLTADQVTFDETLGVVTATGNVELSQGDRIVLADNVTYNQRTHVVVATGNIRLLEPTGDVIFSDYAELTEDLREGFIRNIRMLLADDSRVAGNEGERTSGRFTRIDHAVYSPCDLCATDPTRPPLWQLRAVRVVHDNEAKEVRYRDATLEMFGIPVAYTPYLSHPDPSLDRKTGLLASSFGNSLDLGPFLRTYYYIDVAPDKDATLELSEFGNQGPLLGGEWRQRFEMGSLQLNGSITRGDYVGDSGGTQQQHIGEFRGHLSGKGQFDLTDTWRTGFTASRTTDKNYLRQYYDLRKDMLQSRAFVEGFRGRDYAAATAYAFQDLRPVLREEEPLVLPLAEFSALGEPGSLLGGRWSLDAGLLAISRLRGTDTRRASTEVGWQRDFLSRAGFITTVGTSLRGDVYYADDFRRADLPTTAAPGDITTGRLFPQAQVTVRYPLARQGESSQQLIEPIAAVMMAPNAANNPRIPNEDSQDLEFDETNLFRTNRFTGTDRLEGGLRAAYGLRAGIFGYGGANANLFVGQSYRVHQDSSAPTGSGLENNFSDYVGRFRTGYLPWVDLDYGFRYDNETLKARRHAVTVSSGPPVFRASIGYNFLNQSPDIRTADATAGEMVEYANFGASSVLNKYWTAKVAHSQAMRPSPGPRGSAATLQYQDECLTFQLLGRHDFTARPGLPSGDTLVFFRLTFKNIGEFTSPSLSTAMFAPTGQP